MSKLFTSESVAIGHPDKVADRISDSILDALLTLDSHARVAVETLVKTGMVMVAGEINTHAWVDIEEIVRVAVADCGYTYPELGFDARSVAVITSIGKQSHDINQGVDRQVVENQGAGDQGLMFGYACDETESLMPAPIYYAHKIMQRHADILHARSCKWVRPDAKTQLTFIYEDGEPIGIDTVVLSVQHDEDVTNEEISKFCIEEIVKKVVPKNLLSSETNYLINPTGRFVTGGPAADCGLTGRKIIVDTYGGMARHGGGCFSGKDPSKTDRSAAYMARYIAKNIVAAQLARRCEVQLSYAIGVCDPVAIYIDTFGTGKVSDTKIEEAVRKVFDLTPYGIIHGLSLLRPIYSDLSAFGHFGRDELNLTWESTDKVADLQRILAR